MTEMLNRTMMALMASETLWAMQPQAFSVFAKAFALDGNAPEARSVFADDDEGSAPYELVDGVAVIPVEGVILRQGCPFFGIAGQHEIRAALDAALAAPACRGILFSIHSPGGQARGVKELADSIYAARSKKPCAAFVDGLCASAAYWLASATGWIYAGASSDVGSIGVILRHMDKSGLNGQIGLNFTYITAGAYKAVGNPDAALSDSDRAVLQARVDSIYEMFCGDVASRMGLALENRGAWADGRDFLAAEAEALGLVSSLVAGKTEAITQLLKETHMDRTELAQKHPDLLASIERDAAQAAVQDQAGKIAAAEQAGVANTLAIMETAISKEAAEKVRALVATGMTPDQLAAAATIFGAASDRREEPSGEAAKREEMLQAIRQATPGAVRDGAALKPEDEALAAIQRIGKM